MATQEEDGTTTALCILIDVDEVADDGDGFAEVAGVPMHLSAAGLLGAELDLVAEPLEDADYRLAGVWEEGVVVAGDEERNAQEYLA